MEAQEEMTSEKTLERRKYKRNGHTNRPVRKALVSGYITKAEDDRPSLNEFLKTHRMTKRTFHILEGECRAEQTNSDKEHQAHLRALVEDNSIRLEGKKPPLRTPKGYKIEEVSEDEKVALARKVYNDAIRKGASTRDKELAVRMLGLIIDKKEISIGLTADEIARRNLEADRQLREGGY